jgi:hypothetical protein
VEKIIITIDNRNSMILEKEYDAKTSHEAANILNKVLRELHKQDQIVGIETK